jgi:hypothetical protein
LKKLIITLGIVLIVAASGVQATTWTLKADGTGSWPTIQAAVDASVSGDVIILEAGVYHEADIIIDGKNLVIDQTAGRARLMAPVPGTGTAMTIRNVTAAFTLNSLTFRGYETAVVIEDGSPFVNWVSIKTCDTGVRVSGLTGSPVISYSLIDSCGTGVDVQGGAASILANETIVNCSTGALFSGGSPTLRYSIVASCGTGIGCAAGPTLTCNNLWSNTIDYSGCSAGPTDFFSDPIFCFLTPPSPDLYYLHSTSPCWTAVNPCSKKIGAFVSRVGCTGTSVEMTTWGAIKNIYR